MEETIKKIFSRQYKRMESELLGVNMPEGYFAIISKYWRFVEQDLINSMENGDAMDKDSNQYFNQ
jgi:hypothetical protein